MKPANRQLLLLTGQRVLAAIGIIALSYWATATIGARRFQQRQAQAFNQELEAAGRPHEACHVARRGSPSRHQAPREGSAVAKLTIPDLAVALVVVEGDSHRDLSVGPGHIPGTALPGDSGNVGIAGHRDTVFRPLRLARKDQLITLTTLSGEFRYRVVATDIVDPRDTQVLKPTSSDTLTLVTCYPFDFVGPAPKRFIVRAERVP